MNRGYFISCALPCIIKLIFSIIKDASARYSPGLTYFETVKYYAALTAKEIHLYDLDREINDKVNAILTLMGLATVKDHVIPEDPDTRGTVGGELRRLSIAMAIFDMPAVIVASNPLEGLDFAIAMDLMERLKALALTGRVVVVTSCKPDPVIFNLMSSVVVLSDGYRIFEGKTADICTYFCSDILGYQKSDEISAADFVLQIADGTERPFGARNALSSAELHKTFNFSCGIQQNNDASHHDIVVQILTETSVGNPVDNIIQILSEQPKNFISMFSASYWRCMAILMLRAFKLKTREYTVLQRSFGMSVLVGFLIGYFW